MKLPGTSWRTRIVGIAALVLALPLLACSKPERSGAAADAGPVKVKLALNWVADPEFGGFYAAREGGAFQKNGLDVEIMGGGAGSPVVQMVASGRVEFGISGSDEVLTARARGADIVPLFAVFQTSPHAIMAHRSRGAKGIPDLLTSGTLAIEPGLPYAAFLKKKYGFDRATITPYDGGVARFLVDKNHAQQCFITSEPLVAKKGGADPAVFLIADEGFNPYLIVGITRRELWTTKPDLVRAFRRASLLGWRAYLDDPGPGNAVIAKQNPSFNADMLREVAAVQRPLIETEETKKKGLGTMSRERWEAMGKQLVDLGLIDRAPPVDDYLVPLE